MVKTELFRQTFNGGGGSIRRLQLVFNIAVFTNGLGYLYVCFMSCIYFYCTELYGLFYVYVIEL